MNVIEAVKLKCFTIKHVYWKIIENIDIFLNKLQKLLKYLGLIEFKTHPKTSVFGEEIKNTNSFRNFRLLILSQRFSYFTAKI